MMKTAKNVVITGGNNGVGYETVKSLYQQGHNVIFGARSVQKNQQVVNQITQRQGGSLTSFALDLSKRKSIEQFVNNVLTKFDHVDILINNAGLTISGQKQVNQQGIQMTLAINHFGHFYLTYLLWESLRKSPQARIINVSSRLHYSAPKNYLQDIQCNNKSYDSIDQYNISKLYNVLFTQGLNNLIIKNNNKNIKTASLHPGVIDSGFYQGGGCFNTMSRFMSCCMAKPIDGARTSLYLSRAPFQQIRSGEYYDSNTRVKQMDKRGRNINDVQTLWNISEKVYAVPFR